MEVSKVEYLKRFGYVRFNKEEMFKELMEEDKDDNLTLEQLETNITQFLEKFQYCKMIYIGYWIKMFYSEEELMTKSNDEIQKGLEEFLDFYMKSRNKCNLGRICRKPTKVNNYIIVARSFSSNTGKNFHSIFAIKTLILEKIEVLLFKLRKFLP